MMALLFMNLMLLITLFFEWNVLIIFLITIFIFFLSLFPTNFEYFSYCYYLDTLSFSLSFLSFWVIFLMIMASYQVFLKKMFEKIYLFMMSVLLFSLILSFWCENFLLFYFFFEFSLIPTLLMILGWGYQPERIQSSIYFLFYTLFGSLPLLLLLFMFYNMSGVLNFKMIVDLPSYSFLMKLVLSIMLILAFLIKMPMYFFHLWLPKAHVEAPVAGSMILAGVLLKLGGYGICRVLLVIQEMLIFISKYIIGLSLISMLMVGLQCCRLNDLKNLIAYSSVSHMGLVLAGIISFFMWGFSGGLMMMISHGLASSGLFFMVNVYYERVSSRSMFLNKGMLALIPSFSIFMFLLSAANISAPPTINLLSEIFLMYSVLSFSKFMMLMFPVGSFLGAVFTLYMFSYTQHGKNSIMMYSWIDSSFREFHVLTCHLIPLNILLLSSLFLVF